MHPDPTSQSAPVVARRGSGTPGAPLVVLFHGRGTDERDIISLADQLPEGLTYAALRGPIPLDPGFAWFENEGIGKPVAVSLSATMRWFTAWLDEQAPPRRPVVLIGFSGGALFAGALVLADPSRYAGAALLCGALPFDAGIDTAPGRLTGLPIFVAQGERDTVIPRQFLNRAWDYLVTESGATILARQDPVGHTISADAREALAGWLRTLV